MEQATLTQRERDVALEMAGYRLGEGSTVDPADLRIVSVRQFPTRQFPHGKLVDFAHPADQDGSEGFGLLLRPGMVEEVAA